MVNFLNEEHLEGLEENLEGVSQEEVQSAPKEDDDDWSSVNVSYDSLEEDEEVGDEEAGMGLQETKSIRDEMIEAKLGGSKVMGEYEAVFSEGDRIATIIDLRPDSYNISFKSIDPLDIIPHEPLKESRRETHKGLTQSIRELGVLTPIHVAYTEGYSEFLKKGNVEEDWDSETMGYKYVLLDGLRRVWSALTNKIGAIPAMVWEFYDMDKALDLFVPLSLLLSKTQKRNWDELWGLYQILEMGALMTPSVLEYLLQLEGGDASKLKEIMTRASEEILADLRSGKKSLSQCYNNLQKALKEQDSLELEDSMGISDIDGSDEVVGDSTQGAEQRSYSEVQELLNFNSEDLESLTDDDFTDMQGGIEIDRRAGEDIPRELKQAALARDNYTCQVSGFGEGLPATITLSLLQVHHIIPLYLGGSNTLDNLITLRQDVHTLVHVIERLGGKIDGMDKEKFDTLDGADRKMIFGAFRLGKLIVDEAKRQGRSIVDRALQDASRKASKYKMPGTDLKENMAALEG